MTIAENFIEIKARIETVRRRAGRKNQVALIAVSKMQSDEAIDAALASGHRFFGENKVQEAQAHWQVRKKSYPGLKLHLIGPLQSNKAGDAVALFDCIETIDREKLVDALLSEMKKQGRAPAFYIQVNTGEEDQKAGVFPRDLPALLDYCRASGLSITGLMCIPPADEPPALHFCFLKKLAQRHGLANISMGMSGDFEWAVASGATHVRVGTALFGART